MEDHKLMVMTTKGWEDASTSDSFVGMNDFIRSCLIVGKGILNSNPNLLDGATYFDSDYHIKVVSMELNRYCNVIHLIQTNNKTRGKRYMCYGICFGKPLHRMGITLNHYDPETVVRSALDLKLDVNAWLI